MKTSLHSIRIELKIGNKNAVRKIYRFVTCYEIKVQDSAPVRTTTVSKINELKSEIFHEALNTPDYITNPVGWGGKHFSATNYF